VVWYVSLFWSVQQGHSLPGWLCGGWRLEIPSSDCHMADLESTLSFPPMQWLPVQAHIVLYSLTSFTMDCHNFAQGSGTLQCHPVARSFRCSVVVSWGL
jgi:hypothetical protein